MKLRRLSNFAAVLAIAFLAVGCDRLDYTQYIVSNASPTDQALIKTTVQSTATGAGLVDKTAASKLPATLAFYIQPVPHFPLSLGARMVDKSAVIDLVCFHPGFFLKSPEFEKAETRLTAALTADFGNRLTLPDIKHQVP